jgi:2-polyprenyl-3-methyl-5-hydroxy-6-metoxy-1,4-benzoquinol methylase
MRKDTFEESYFAGHYKSHVGDFQMQNLNPAIRWFHGWFDHLNKFVDVKYGNRRKALEIGCSIGGASHALYERGFDVYASDISKYAVVRAEKLARKLGRDIKFFVCDVQKAIPLKEQFDLIICFEVIEHLEDPLKAIKNLRDKLKKDGILICSTPNGDNDVYFDPTHINVRPAKEWEKTFKKARFSDVTLSQVTFIPFVHRLNMHITLPFPIYSRYINAPLFIIARK